MVIKDPITDEARSSVLGLELEGAGSQSSG